MIGKLVDAGIAFQPIPSLLESAGVAIDPLTAEDATLAGALRSVERGTELSLADHCCIATGIRHDATVLTADRLWSEIALPVAVELIR